jgi:hypothetical protein
VEVAYGWRDARALVVEPLGEREQSSPGVGGPEQHLEQTRRTVLCPNAVGAGRPEGLQSQCGPN